MMGLLGRNLDFAKLALLKWLWKAYFQSYRPPKPLYGKLRHRRFIWDPPNWNRRWSPIDGFFKNARKSRISYVLVSGKSVLESTIFGSIISKTTQNNRLCLAVKMRPSKIKSEVVPIKWNFQKPMTSQELENFKFLVRLQMAITWPFFPL